ncbi:hypothetical protein SCHPADRAFT_364841 [Schizopora paradoxa]|uniref:Hydrophobin n=1 Tax=Schizopora paradoxa TaxID=27342 RepID=A0A0H2RP36_9AGAM|nr:hypothetical protein SCHPADRAFT_364841 [Schizopora paradoxa]
MQACKNLLALFLASLAVALPESIPQATILPCIEPGAQGDVCVVPPEGIEIPAACCVDGLVCIPSDTLSVSVAALSIARAGLMMRSRHANLSIVLVFEGSLLGSIFLFSTSR